MIDILKKNPEIWNLFTRKEEYDRSLRDQFDRFPYYASQNRNIFEPTVSKYLIERGFNVEYPENKSFAVCLTHDIDNIFTSVPIKGLSVVRHLKQLEFQQTFQSIARMRSKKIPLHNFTSIMDLEEKFNAKSTFFFMAEGHNEQDFAYNIDDLEVEIGKIIDRGWDVGLHGGNTTYLNKQTMKEKKNLIEKMTHKPLLGYRNHYLRFRVPDTWEYLYDAGFKYDTTLGFADCAGFRNGMCHPFRPINLHTNQEIKILEIPLIVMDATLDQTYMRLDNNGKWEFVKMLIDRVAEYHGVFTLLWHNTSFFGKRGEFYERILKYCTYKNAWITSGEEIFSFFN